MLSEDACQVTEGYLSFGAICRVRLRMMRNSSRGYCTASNSTSKINSAFAGMTGGEPRVP